MGTGRRASRLRQTFVLCLFSVSFLLFPTAPAAQNVVDLLIEQRRDARVAEIMAEIGDRVPPRGQRLGQTDDPVMASYYAIEARERAVRDSVRFANDVAADSVILAARLASARWRKVEAGEQGDFLDRYRETYWQAVRDRRNGALDTTATPVLRGQLQAAFGRPTRNADAQRRYGYGGSEFVQFEYWFVVNDSIPILALDIDGPFGRGLLVAGAEEQVAYHAPLKATLAARLGAARLDPYVDYYRSFERERWYRTGYNGAEFYTLPVRRPPRWSGQAESDRWIIHR